MWGVSMVFSKAVRLVERRAAPKGGRLAAPWVGRSAWLLAGYSAAQWVALTAEKLE